MSSKETAERRVRVEEPVEGPEVSVPDPFRGETAEADAEDPTMGGSSDGDTSA